MSHDHAHEHRIESSATRILVAIAANAVFIGAEVYASFVADSSALRADAGHNFTDVLALVLAWAAILLGGIAPSSQKSFGYKKATVVASFVGSALLVWALIEMASDIFSRLGSGSAVNTNGLLIAAVAALGVLVNGFSAWLLRSDSNDLNYRSAYLHMLVDAVVSAGVVVSGLLIHWLKWHWIDAAISIVILVVIGKSAWRLVLDSANLLLDGVPSHIDLEVVKKFLLGQPGVRNCHDLHIWAISTSQTALAVHLLVEPEIASHKDFLQELQHELQEYFSIDHFTIQVDLDEDCEFDCSTSREKGDLGRSASQKGRCANP
ncbi:MAG: cation transporter [Fibrobacteres bacterium]|nr:cation transporter [Fibrobacterota bacterium]